MLEKTENILIVANCFWYVYNFRLDLIKLLKASGYKVFVIAPSDPYKNLVKEYVDEVKDWNLSRGSINPFLEIKSIWQLISFYKKIKPKLIHNFTIKPSLYGGIAGRITGQKIIISHITGIGPSFFGFSKTIRILSYLLNPIYRFSFFKNSKLIFHNKEDVKIFLKKRICKKETQCVIQGSGVNMQKFNNDKIKEKYYDPIQVLFPSRIIREKGFIELFAACFELWEEGFVFKLNVAGEIDKENRSTLTIKEINDLGSNKNINFCGKIEDMKKIYLKTDIVVLPSWREGLSKSLIEAASMCLPIITSDVPGCKEIIENNKSGILIPSKNKFLLKESIKKLIQNPKLGIQYGLKARERVKDKFELSLINNEILEIYNQLLNSS